MQLYDMGQDHGLVTVKGQPGLVLVCLASFAARCQVRLRNAECKARGMQMLKQADVARGFQLLHVGSVGLWLSVRYPIAWAWYT
jgi:hypothetical protein